MTLAWQEGSDRLSQTVVPASAPIGIAGTNEYGYDAQGKRVWKKITRDNAVVEHTVYIYAGPNCIAEYSAGVSADTPDGEYVYGDSINSLVMIARDNNSQQLTVAHNQQWSVCGLLDVSDGSIVELYSYDTFGNRTILEPDGTTVRPSSNYNNPYGYTCRRHDAETGLMYYRLRYFDPTTGQFISQDPLEYVDGMSLYRGYFVPGQIDPFGLNPVVLRTLLSWVGKYLKVRQGYLVAGLAAGTTYQTIRALSANDALNNIGWGSISGKSVLNDWNTHWNDKGAGNGEIVQETSRPMCSTLAGSGTLSYQMDYGWFWADDNFFLSLDFDTDGCNLNNLDLRFNNLANNIRFHSMKLAIMSVETFDGGNSPLCGLTPCPKCGCNVSCKPKCLEIQLDLEVMHRGNFWNGPPISAQVKFVICADVLRNGPKIFEAKNGPNWNPVGAK